MTDKSEIPAYENVNAAPVVYFDIAPAHGIMGGIIQIELASRILNAMSDGGVDIKFITTGRLPLQPDRSVEPTKRSRCLAQDVGATAARAGGNGKAELKGSIGAPSGRGSHHFGGTRRSTSAPQNGH